MKRFSLIEILLEMLANAKEIKNLPHILEPRDYKTFQYA